MRARDTLILIAGSLFGCSATWFALGRPGVGVVGLVAGLVVFFFID